jgi:hypothetical protein
MRKRCNFLVAFFPIIEYALGAACYYVIHATQIRIRNGKLIVKINRSSNRQIHGPYVKKIQSNGHKIGVTKRNIR